MLKWSKILKEEGIKMQTTIVYIIGALAVSYFIITTWKKLKGQGSCCGSSSSGCGGCGSAEKCK